MVNRSEPPMNDTPSFDESPVDRFLEAPQALNLDTSLRQSLRSQTTGLLRRRRRWKQAGYVVGLAVCYAAGLLTMRVHDAPTKVPTGPELVEHTSDSEKPTKGVPPASPGVALAQAELSLEQDPSVPIMVLERVAASTPAEQRFPLLRRAGDRYLE